MDFNVCKYHFTIDMDIQRDGSVTGFRNSKNSERNGTFLFL